MPSPTLIDSRASCLPLDEIYVPIGNNRFRAVIVKQNLPWGLEVLWFMPNGVGPFIEVLPHVMLDPVLYRPVAAGESKSHFKMQEDEIIENYERIRKEIKD